MNFKKMRDALRHKDKGTSEKEFEEWFKEETKDHVFDDPGDLMNARFYARMAWKEGVRRARNG